MRIEKRTLIFLSIILLVCLFVNGVFAIGENLGGAGLGAANGDIQTAMQAVQQIIQVISQALGSLKADLQSNSQAEHTRLAKINAPRLPDDPGDTQTPQILGEEVSDNRVEMNFTGLEITLADRNTGNKLIIQNRANVIGMFNTNKSLENTITGNTTTLVTKSSQDLGVVRVGNETTLIDSGGASLVPVEGAELLMKGFLPLISAGELGTSMTFSRQYVVFVDQDIFINGNDILFFPLKNFDQIILNGSKLTLMEQDSDLIIDNENTFYSRKIGRSNFFVNKLINENKKEVYFRLLEGGTKGTYLIDNKKILSVGENAVQNPLEDYENVSISKNRLEMWRRAA